MSSAITKLRQHWKENEPEKYAAYLESQRINNKRRRDEKKRKWQEETHTRGMEEQRERELMLARQRNKRHRQKKAEESGRKTTASKRTPIPVPTNKRRCEMTEEERRAHDSKVRTAYNHSLSHQKRTANKAKNKMRMRKARAEEREKKDRHSMVEGAMNMVKRLPKTLLNVGSKIRQTLKATTKGNAQHYAKMVKNLATPRTPEKRKAVRALFGTPTAVKNKSVVRPAPKTKKRTQRIALTIAARRRNAIESKIVNYYMSSEVARPLPHKRYATKAGPGYAMIVTIRTAHRLYCSKYPDFKAGYTKFCNSRPKNVRKLGSVAVETCLCLCCQNLRYKIDVLNRHLDPRDRLPYESKILDVILCSREGRWHKIKCVRGQCENCMDFLSPIEVRCNSILTCKVRWLHWERRKTAIGTRLDVYPNEENKNTILDLLQQMRKDLLQPVRGTNFAEHLFTAYWQQDQFKHLLNTLVPGEVLMVEDFAENRKATYSAEVKSAYFSKRQITLHPIVCYYKDCDYQVVRHSLMYVSDDTLHDHHLVNHFTLHALEFLKTETTVLSAYIYSDGCAGQYKGKGTFADLSLMSGLRVQRVFYGSEHGKGEADGETGSLSQAMDRHIKGGNNISSAKDLFDWASSQLTKGEGLKRRSFFLIDSGDVRRDRPQTEVHTVPGTRKMHQVERVNDFIIKSRQLACFCCACKMDRLELCINKSVVGEFQVVKLKQAHSPLDDAFLEPPEDVQEEAEEEIQEPPKQIEEQDTATISVGSYVKWTYTIGKKTLSYNALVLAVVAEENLVHLSCMRQKPGSSHQGDVWVFPESPDLSWVSWDEWPVTKLGEPTIDFEKKLYIF